MSSVSPLSSCVSIKTVMDPPLILTEGDSSSGHSVKQVKRPDSSLPSCVSMKSDMSMDHPLVFKDGEPSPGHSVLQMGGNRKDKKIVTDPGCEPSYAGTDVQEKCKLKLIKKFQHMSEVITDQGNPTLLNEIYTELYITEGDSGKVNNEHEVRQIEAASRRAATEETPIKCSDIFKPLPEEDKPIRSVLTKGVAGIGKTVCVQKFILDWAEGETNQDVHLIFPLPFRELNLMKDKLLSLMELLHFYIKEIKETNISSLHKFLFIFDGLDECRFPLDFQNTVRVCDVTEPASVDVLLINLIKGNLLPSALVWITSRPAAADQIPSESFNRVTEVRGFNDPQKEEYFRKRIRDQSLSNRIITHLKSLRSLYIMCHIPVFCWISATVLERLLGKAESGEIPKTLTQMYTHFLIIQTNIIKKKYTESRETDNEMVLKLGKLAFQQLMKGNLIFYEEDLMECGIDVTEASVYSGVCTQIFREEFGLHQSKVYCFVHLSIQEHLAALYVHLTFMNEKKNVLQCYSALYSQQSLLSKIWAPFKKVPISDVHKSAVDQALQSENGHLDLFLRFLLGLSLESNQILLQTRHGNKRSISYSKQETVHYIKEKIRENPSTEKSINLFHCLNELEDHSLVEEIQHYIQSGNLQHTELSPSQWSAVVFVLLTSVQEQDVFVLKKYINKHCTSDEVLLKLLPVVAASRKAELNNCGLNKKSCAVLASVLSSESSNLRELNLTGNKLRVSGVKSLSAGLENPHCKLETLRLCDCEISDEGCAALTSALRSNPSHLRELDLSGNKLRDSGVKSLSAVLENPHCKLETLRLCYCEISDEGCAALSSALRSNPSHLRELDLSGNKLSDSGVKSLSAVLENPHCKLETLRLCDCEISDEGCAALSSALRSNPSHLRELDLSWNKLRDSGVKSLSAVLENPHCKLETLRLCDCEISDEGCAALSSALRSNPSLLRELDLSRNNLSDSGVKSLSAVLENPHFKLETLRLCGSGVSDEGCAALSSALRSNPSHLRELDLSGNKLSDSGVKSLSVVLENPHCKLETLRLCGSGVSDEGCAALTSALRSNPSHLRELDLSRNKLSDSGVKSLSAVLKNPHCKLETLRLCECEISDEGCAALSSALRSNPSHLRELDLSWNNLTDSGVKSLSAVLENPHCKLETLRLCYCEISDEGCAALSSALRSNPSHLRELDLSWNKLRDSGVKSLSAVLENPHCKLETLRLCYCEISDEGCAALSSALRSNPSHLRELDLTGNNLRDSGVKSLSAVLENPHCKLETLRMRGCEISDEGCAALTSALTSNPSHLTVLDLSWNNLRDSGVKSFSAVLENPHCKLETLRLCGSGVSDKGCAALSSALRSNPSHLRELDLSWNKLSDSGVKSLTAVLENPHCKLETLRLCNCEISDEGSAALTSALRSNPSHLRELDLTGNKFRDSGANQLFSLKLQNLRL
ncbi:NACHT, LRR and PYD domains-containing protein 12-like isoform X3 [Tachysurus vachellii]|uniref:NACHT, LRR and PYD domains-containing protein 12-like isoform X3 n=1 Tax=Tachysurus vachellii TaxID=175792 RepID=UPI00296AD0A4|nr:NACHT, LRR and PYD domains-containing protein 12-like isoform X3 [Tachysurus vachellii]